MNIKLLLATAILVIGSLGCSPTEANMVWDDLPYNEISSTNKGYSGKEYIAEVVVTKSVVQAPYTHSIMNVPGPDITTEFIQYGDNQLIEGHMYKVRGTPIQHPSGVWQFLIFEVVEDLGAVQRELPGDTTEPDFRFEPRFEDKQARIR